MAFLGSFFLGQTIRLALTWTVDPGSPAIIGTNVTLTHEESGTVIGPQAASLEAEAWTALVTPTLRGTWRADWDSVPAGGVHTGDIYVS